MVRQGGAWDQRPREGLDMDAALDKGSSVAALVPMVMVNPGSWMFARVGRKYDTTIVVGDGDVIAFHHKSSRPVPHPTKIWIRWKRLAQVRTRWNSTDLPILVHPGPPLPCRTTGWVLSVLDKCRCLEFRRISSNGRVALNSCQTLSAPISSSAALGM